jgi:hypothetical protein
MVPLAVVTVDIVNYDVPAEPSHRLLTECGCRSSSRWAQWSVETSNTVHVLPVFGLLLLSDSVDVVSWHLGVLCAFERGETHHLPKQSIFVVFIWHNIFVAIGSRFFINLHSLQFGLSGLGAQGTLVFIFGLITLGWSITVGSRPTWRRSGARGCVRTVAGWRTGP